MNTINGKQQYKQFMLPALALAVASTLFAAQTMAQTSATAAKPVASATKPDAKPDAKADTMAQAIMKFSQDGSAAMRDVRGARVAIFNGNPKLAMQLMEKAKTLIAAAEKDAPSFEVKTTMSVQGKVLGSADVKDPKQLMVPIDGQIMLAENFVPTPEKQAHINKANEHFKNGRHKEALEELRLGEIDINYTRFWLPIPAAKKHLDQAIKLSRDNKYYEANLALKAIEDGITVDAVNLTETPKK